MRGSAQRVTDGDTADFYLVPFLSKCYFNLVAQYKLRPMDAVLSEVLSYLLLCRPEGEPPDPHATMDEEQRVEALAARSRRCLGCCAARPSNS